MNTLKEKFYVYIRSSFRENRRTELFEYIWHHYSRRISYYIANLIPFRHPAFEDVFQDVMLKIYNHLPDFNPARSFKAWVYKIARNHCLDFLKNKGEQMFASKINIGSEIPDSDEPEKTILRGEIRARIDNFLQKLDSQDREIAYLRFYENLRYKELSRIMNMNANTLRSKIHLWKKELEQELRGYL